jgi:hypothetical protein
LVLSRTVVLRYRIHLESRNLAPGTINFRLAAVWRLAYEAADAGLELAAGIRRVKGAKKLGVRLGNWLSANEARALWQSPDAGTRNGKRDRAIIAVLLGCGLRRRELADLTFDHLQRREERWTIVDLVGKGGHSELFVRPSPGPGGKWQISAGGGVEVAWSRASHELLYRTADNRIIVVSYRVEGESFKADKPRLWSEQAILQRPRQGSFDGECDVTEVDATDAGTKPKTN